MLEFTCAAAASLDPYSSYLTGDQLDEVFSQIEGNFVGLGIELKAEERLAVDRQCDSRWTGGSSGHRAATIGLSKSMARTTREVSTDAAADMLKGPELSYRRGRAAVT